MILRATTVSMSTIFYLPIVNDLQVRGYNVVSVSSSGKELDELRNLGVKVIEVPMERNISFLKDIKSLRSLIRVFREERPYMVHSMTPKAGLLCMIAAWVCRVPRRVHTFTGLVWPTTNGIKRKVLMLTDWITCLCATHIIPEGQGVLNDLQCHITRKPMRVLGYGNVRGVDMTRFSLSPEIVIKASELSLDNVFTFIFVGRLVGDKGINELVEAFLRLLNESYKVRLFLVGRYEETLDPLMPITLERIKDTRYIEAVGQKINDELLAYYAASDCFVFPSYREGFPNTVMEAGAMGIPSIVTDINGSREIISDGKNGLIVPSKNVEALYDAMKRIIEDEPYRKKMAKNARPMIESRFEQRFVRKCLMDFYDEIMY